MIHLRRDGIVHEGGKSPRILNECEEASSRKLRIERREGGDAGYAMRDPGFGREARMEN
jgi:hypothetical protein